MARGREPAVRVYDVYTYKSHPRITARGDTGRWHHHGDKVEPGKWELNSVNQCALRKQIQLVCCGAMSSPVQSAIYWLLHQS